MIQYEKSNKLVDVLFAKKMLAGLENYYPDFEYWFVNSCMPGILVGNDQLILAKEKGDIIGVALSKRNKHETKLRCVRVLPEYQQKGVGIHLIDKSLVALGHDKPYCTVPEEMLHQFSRAFINHFGFQLTSVNKGMYRPQRLEYLFNG
jgi:GNAT superfamily N-acetyltransferase